MSNSTENSTGNLSEIVRSPKPVSVYTADFTQILNEKEKEFLIRGARLRKTPPISGRASFSKSVFNWRNALAVAAILAVGVLHFVFQVSFINRENKAALRVAEVPPVVEAAREQNAAIEPADFTPATDETVLPPAPAPVIKRRLDAAPPKIQLKKREATESRAERLRRAEKILTGI